MKASRLIAPMPRRTRVDDSGTEVRFSLNAIGPPGIAWMVTVAPLPMVNVPWTMDAAVRVAPLSTCVIPLPFIAPTACVPFTTSKVASGEVLILRFVLFTLTVFKTALPD